MVGGHATPAGGMIAPDILVLERSREWEVLGKRPMPPSSRAAAIMGGKLNAAGGSATGRRAEAEMWVADLPGSSRPAGELRAIL